MAPILPLPPSLFSVESEKAMLLKQLELVNKKKQANTHRIEQLKKNWLLLKRAN